jgi:hypothetical protein
LGESLKGLETSFLLVSDTSDLDADDIELFVGSEWPSQISSIIVETKDVAHKICITMLFSGKEKSRSRVMISGSDAVWVNGMSEQLKKVFEKHRTWYDPIARYLKARLAISLGIIFLLSWLLNRSLWRFAIEPVTKLAELQSFVVWFVFLLLLIYPLNRVLRWLFPYLECGHTPQKAVRKIFWSLLVLLICWVVTQFVFPQLVP